MSALHCHCPASLHVTPPPLTGGGWGVGAATNGSKGGTFPPTLTLPRQGGGNYFASELKPNRTIPAFPAFELHGTKGKAGEVLALPLPNRITRWADLAEAGRAGE